MGIITVMILGMIGGRTDITSLNMGPMALISIGIIPDLLMEMHGARGGLSLMHQ
jgi:hypothetical protein